MPSSTASMRSSLGSRSSRAIRLPSCAPRARSRGLAGRRGPRGRRAGRRRLAAQAPALAGGCLVHRLALARAALTAAAGHLVHRRPGAPLRFAPGYAAPLIARFDLAGLAALFARVFRFVASRHGDPPTLVAL